MVKILGAFEANSFSEYDLRLARERWTAAASSTSSVSRGLSSLGGVSSKRKRGADAAVGMEGGFNTEGGETFVRQGEKMGGGGGGGYFGLKYLTSSRLLRLQLRDPTLRLQVPLSSLVLVCAFFRRDSGRNMFVLLAGEERVHFPDEDVVSHQTVTVSFVCLPHLSFSI